MACIGHGTMHCGNAAVHSSIDTCWAGRHMHDQKGLLRELFHSCNRSCTTAASNPLRQGGTQVADMHAMQAVPACRACMQGAEPAITCTPPLCKQLPEGFASVLILFIHVLCISTASYGLLLERRLLAWWLCCSWPSCTGSTLQRCPCRAAALWLAALPRHSCS
jgi:hypothetical protein